MRGFPGLAAMPSRRWQWPRTGSLSPQSRSTRGDTGDAGLGCDHRAGREMKRAPDMAGSISLRRDETSALHPRKRPDVPTVRGGRVPCRRHAIASSASTPYLIPHEQRRGGEMNLIASCGLAQPAAPGDQGRFPGQGRCPTAFARMIAVETELSGTRRATRAPG